MTASTRGRSATRAALLTCALALAGALAACSAPGDPAAPSGPRSPPPVQDAGLRGFERIVAVGPVWLASQPTAEGLVNARDAGATLVINARPAGEMSFEEGAVARMLGMKYVSIPFTATTLGGRQIDEFRRVMREHDGRALVHCSSGNRVAALWAAWEITEQGVPVDEAIARARRAGLKSPELIGALGDYLRAEGIAIE